MIRARRGNDVVCGLDGNDTLNGNLGDDQLFGGQGNDVLRGHRDVDYMDGGFNLFIPKRGLQEFDLCAGGSPAGSPPTTPDPDFATQTCEFVKRASTGGT